MIDTHREEREISRDVVITKLGGKNSKENEPEINNDTGWQIKSSDGQTAVHNSVQLGQEIRKPLMSTLVVKMSPD